MPRYTFDTNIVKGYKVDLNADVSALGYSMDGEAGEDGFDSDGIER